MLSVFPELFNYSQVAPFLLRAVLGIVLIIKGREEFTGSFDKTNKSFGVIKAMMGILLILGLFTQPAAIIIAVLTLAEIIILKKRHLPIEKESLRALIIAVSISLIFLGPGLFSLDLPL